MDTQLPWPLTRTLIALFSTYEVFGIRVVGFELPFLIMGLFSWFAVFVLRTTALGIAFYRRFIYRHRPSAAARERYDNEGVSILKPLKGVDKELKSNLESFFRLSYPKFEILFSIDDEKDPAGCVAKELIQKYPKVDARLVISEPADCQNPKINNLLTSYNQAKYNFIWQSDSNMIVEPQVLGRMVHCLDKKVGIVHQLPLCSNPKTLFALMEMCYISTWHATMYLFFNYFADTHCVVGKSLLFRKSDAEALGGLRQYSKYLAEDYFFSKAFWLARWRLRISPDASFQNLGHIGFLEYWTRQARWTRLRYSTQPLPTFFEVFTTCITSGFLAYHPMKLVFGISPHHFLPLHLAIWLGTDLLQAICFYGFHPLSLLMTLPAWLLRELLAVPLTTHAAMGAVVLWRGKFYKIKEGSTVAEEDVKPHLL